LHPSSTLSLRPRRRRLHLEVSVQREGAFAMLRNVRSSHLSTAFKLRLSILLNVFACVLLLGNASPLWAQVTTTQAAVSFGSVAVGAATGSTQSLTFTVPSGITLGGISAETQGAANLDFTVAKGAVAPVASRARSSRFKSGSCHRLPAFEWARWYLPTKALAQYANYGSAVRRRHGADGGVWTGDYHDVCG